MHLVQAIITLPNPLCPEGWFPFMQAFCLYYLYTQFCNFEPIALRATLYMDHTYNDTLV